METNQLTFEHICFKYKGNDNQLFTDWSSFRHPWGFWFWEDNLNGDSPWSAQTDLPTISYLGKWKTCDSRLTFLVLCAPTESASGVS